jgi:hypothetical protein
MPKKSNDDIPEDIAPPINDDIPDDIWPVRPLPPPWSPTPEYLAERRKSALERRELDLRRREPSGPRGLHWHGEIVDEPLLEWLVDDLLPRTGVALLVGQWGMLKTFVALDAAGRVMTKTAFAGREVKRQAGALFIAAEGQAYVRLRVEGLARGTVANAEAPDDAAEIRSDWMPFAWIKACPRLTDDGALDELRRIVAEAAGEMQERFGLPLGLVVIDALMPAAGFRSANDSAEAQRVMDVMAAIARIFDLLVLAIDHFGKDVTAGTRDSSAKEGAVDTVLAVLGQRSVAGKVSNARLVVRKSRGAQTGAEIPFAAREVTVHDENASPDAATTLVIDWTSHEAPVGKSVVEQHKAAIADRELRVLKALAANPQSTIRDLAAEAKVSSTSTLTRTLERLRKQKLAHQTLGKWAVTKAGTETLGSVPGGGTLFHLLPAEQNVEQEQ